MVRKSIASNIVLNLARSNPKHEDRGEVNVQKFVVTSSQSLFIDGLQLVREKLTTGDWSCFHLIAFLTAESNLEISLRSNARLQIEIIKKLWWKKFVNVLALHLIAITVSGTNFHLNKLELFLYNI